MYIHTHNLTLVAEKVHSQQFLPAGKAQAISAPLPDCLIILPPPPWIQRAWVSISRPDSSCVCFFLLYRTSKKRPLSLYSPSLYQAVTDIILCRTFSQWDITVCVYFLPFTLKNTTFALCIIIKMAFYSWLTHWTCDRSYHCSFTAKETQQNMLAWHALPIMVAMVTFCFAGHNGFLHKTMLASRMSCNKTCSVHTY